jgi:hypothetical protein
MDELAILCTLLSDVTAAMSSKISCFHLHFCMVNGGSTHIKLTRNIALPFTLEPGEE